MRVVVSGYSNCGTAVIGKYIVSFLYETPSSEIRTGGKAKNIAQKCSTTHLSTPPYRSPSPNFALPGPKLLFQQEASANARCHVKQGNREELREKQ